MVHGGSEEELHVDLWEAVRAGARSAHRKAPIKFLHDRVQEAAYSLDPGRIARRAHLRIGRLLAAHTPPERREETGLRDRQPAQPRRRPDHLAEEREQLAELNLIAGKRAKASTAYARL